MGLHLPDLTKTPKLHSFVDAMGLLLQSAPVESRVMQQGKALLGQLIQHDDWLPEAFSIVNPERYQQFLLYVDPKETFSVVSFVWGPGQATPIHNHTVWGLVGVLRGCEESQAYRFNSLGECVPDGPSVLMQPGDVDCVSPLAGDIHAVSNAHRDGVSISIHVYGANIGKVRRNVFREDGSAKEFISGYSNLIVD
jgi:predicted metal-dependent enzyme (double-stranded beta helix superfamily)